MPAKPFDQYGRIVATGGIQTTAIRIANGWNPKQITGRLTAKYGELPPDVEQRVMVSASRSLDAGRVVTNTIGAMAAELLEVPVNKIMMPVGTVRISSLNQAIAEQQAANFAAMSERFGAMVAFNKLHLMPELFGENPSAYRALLTGQITGTAYEAIVRLDLQLSGGETWLDVIDRAVKWYLNINENYSDRFEDLDEEEIIDLSLQVVTADRKW